MSEYHDDSSFASDPVDISLSHAKLSRFKKRLPFFERLINSYPAKMLDEHLSFGDSRGAIVMSTTPHLIVAAFTDELDCVVLLEFHKEYIHDYNLTVGSRLLTVNTYSIGKVIASDLEQGPLSYNRYSNFYPLIAEFLTDDLLEVENRKAEISEKEWTRVSDMGKEKIQKKLTKPRNGSPYSSASPKKIDNKAQ